MARKFLTPAQLSKIIFNQESDAGLQQGELIYDQEHLGLMFGLSASTQLEIGQQSIILSYNNTGSTIPAGRAVYGTGATNNRPSISPSTSATAEQSSRTFGVTAEPVLNGGYGWVTTSGILTGIDTSLYVAGDELWLSSSSPGILVTSPIGPPNHDLLVGYCVTSSSVDGAIYLTFNRGVDVSGIHDIVLNSQANNDLLVYNSASNVWINEQINQVPFDDIPYIDFSTASTVPVSDVAKLVWDNGEGTLTFGLKGGNVDLNIGQEQVALCYNGTGSTLTDGQVVYISGAQGQRPRISLAQANTESSSSKALGIVTETIANGAEGFITTFGMVNNVDTSAFTAGQALWLSPTVAGGLTATKPTSPNHLVFIGYAVSINASSGKIFVNPQNGYEFDELHDVLITSKADNDIITYNGSSSVWVNQNLNAAILEVDGSGSNIDADLLDGQHGSYYLDWTNVTNKPDPVITLGGDLSGSVTLTDLGSGTLTATIGANSVALGSDTTGNYVAQITGTTDQVTVTGSGSESASVTLSLPQSIATSSSPTFAGLTTTSRITTPASVTGTAPLRMPHGTAPSSPVDGDIWTTTAGIYVRVNGSTIGPLGTGGGGTVTVSDTAPVGPSVGDLWYESDTGQLYIYYDSFWVETVGSGGAANDLSAYLTIASASATYLTQTSASTIYAPLASPTFTGTVTAATLDLTTAATATAATSYWVETGSDGILRPKTLANAQAEIVTTTSVNSASATVLGTVTNGTWQGSVISATYIDSAIARLASPALSGTPTAPTASAGTNTTQVATTEFVQTAVNTVTTNSQSASYQLVLSDAGKVVEMNVGTANNLTIPASGTVNFPIGTTIDVVQYGSGQTTIVAAGGVTIRSANSALKLTNQYSAVSLYKRGTDEWVAMGDLTV